MSHDAPASPVWDVHAHYLPREAIEVMGIGPVQVRLDTWQDVADNITVNGMPVGATIHQLSDPDYLIAASDRAGVDIRVLSPPPFTYRYWDDPTRSVELCRLLNNATADIVSRFPDRFRGLATVPLQDAELAAAEWRRARDELGLEGVTVGTNVDGENVDAPARRGFLAGLAEDGAPLLVHPDFVPSPRISSHYLVNMVGMPTETAITMSNMLFSGLFDEIPALRVCFVHGGGSAPYILGRWDVGWQVRPESRTDADRSPSAYLGNIFCDTLTHSPVALTYLVEIMGPENVVLGTDLPFDVEEPDPRGHLRRAPRLDDATRQIIETVSPLRWLKGDRG
jgi:aminocarboxymuconate-semialdehyde decarboxylase